MLPHWLNRRIVQKLWKRSLIRQRLKDFFVSIKDPRVERTRLHQLGDILTIAILAVLAGGNGWEDMEVYGLSKQERIGPNSTDPNSRRDYSNGYEEIKTIKGLQYLYRRWYENGKKRSEYLGLYLNISIVPPNPFIPSCLPAFTVSHIDMNKTFYSPIT